MPKITFSFINETKQKIPHGYFLFNLEKNIHHLAPDIKNAELNLILVDRKKIKELNKKYRKKDIETDVLSFPIDIESPGDEKKIKENNIILGDIYICPDFVKDEDSYSNEELLARLHFLFIHGIIHLLGYDHMTDEDEKRWEEIIDGITDQANTQQS